MRKIDLDIIKQILAKCPSAYKLYRFLKDYRWIFTKPKKTPMGFRLIGNSAMQEGRFEIEETKIVRKILPCVDTLVNVGANIGYYCCMASYAGKNVICFEPMTNNLRYLLRNIKTNGYQNSTEVFPLALSNRPGIVEIYGGGTGASLINGWANTPKYCTNLVPTSTMDIILAHRLKDERCLIIVDIEGSEKRMLEGATSLVSLDPKPIWLVEISICQHQPNGIKVNPELLFTFEVFWKEGYDVWTVNNGLRKINHEQIRDVMKNGKDTVHSNSFLFVEKRKAADLIDLIESEEDIA